MNNIVFIENNEVVTDSLMVAEVFGKRHDSVLRDIQNTLEIVEEDSRHNFVESNYINERGRKYKKYNLTKDGFTILVMGFNGKEALQFKMMYIKEFNRMDKIKETVGYVENPTDLFIMTTYVSEQNKQKYNKLIGYSSNDFSLLNFAECDYINVHASRGVYAIFRIPILTIKFWRVKLLKTILT